MGEKDHLPNPEEAFKKQKRDLKRIVSINYQGAPPVITGSIDSVGKLATTIGEIKDVAFPVLPDINDLTDNVQTAIAGATSTLQVALDNAETQFQRLKLDDVGGTITNFIIDLTNLAKNKALEFITDIETVFTGTPTVAFQANGTPITMDGLPPSWPLGKTKFKFKIAAIETPTVTSYEVLSSSNDFGSGGVSFPITPTVNILGTVTTTQDIDLSAVTAHSTSMTLGASISITFSNYPTTGTQIEWELQITQDSTGGRVITWPSEITNPPTLNTTADSIVVVVLRTNDGGTTVRVANTVTTTGSGNVADWANNPAVADIDFATFDGKNIDRLRFVIDSGAPSSTSDPSIFLDASGDMVFNVNTLDNIAFKALNVEIAKFTELTSGVYRLDMLEHAIDNARDVRLSNDQGTTIFAGTEPAIGFDSTNSRFIINYPTGASVFVFENQTLGTTIFKVNSIESNIVTANDLLQLGVDVTVPTVVGEFRNNGTDVTVFSGGSVVNLSNISGTFSDSVFRIQDNIDATKQIAFEASGITTATTRTITMPDANTALVLDDLSNLTTITSINSNLLPQSGKTLGSSSNIWSRLTVNKLTLGTAGTFSITDNEIIADAATGMEFNTPTGDLFSFFFGGGAASITIGVSQMRLISGTLRSFGFSTDDNTAYPIVTGDMRRNGDGIGWEIDEFQIRRTTTVAAEVATISLTKVDATPIANDDVGTLNFQVEDTGITTVYGDITTAIIDATDNSVMTLNVRANNGLIAGMLVSGDDNNQRIMVRIGGTDQARIQPLLGEMGYFVTTQVTDFSLIIGTAGSLEIPQFSNGSPTLTQLNSAFGAFDGAIGQDTFDGKLYVRKSSTVWSFYAEGGTVT